MGQTIRLVSYLLVFNQSFLLLCEVVALQFLHEKKCWVLFLLLSQASRLATYSSDGRTADCCCDRTGTVILFFIFLFIVSAERLHYLSNPETIALGYFTWCLFQSQSNLVSSVCSPMFVRYLRSWDPLYIILPFSCLIHACGFVWSFQLIEFHAGPHFLLPWLMWL